MAEAVALAASVAGLTGLAGQILQGCIFIRKFFEHVRDAPEEVLDLRDELELFTLVASDTEKLFQRAGDDEMLIPAVQYKRILERCANIVKDIADRLEQYAGKPEGWKRQWWSRLKVASRKRTLAECMRREHLGLLFPFRKLL